MQATVEAPIELVRALSDFRIPPRLDAKLQMLMDRNTEGALTSEEREELESLVEFSESISLLRAQSLQLLADARRKSGLLPGSVTRYDSPTEPVAESDWDAIQANIDRAQSAT